MKLTRALTYRKTLETETEKMKNEILDRIYNFNAKNSEKAKESVIDLLKKYDTKVEAYEKLIIKINKANAETIVDGQRLADLLVKRAGITNAVERAQTFAETAVVSRATTTTEIRMVPSIRSAELYKYYDVYRQKLCDLEMQIQSANWSVEVDVEEPVEKPVEVSVA